MRSTSTTRTCVKKQICAKKNEFLSQRRIWVLAARPRTGVSEPIMYFQRYLRTKKQSFDLLSRSYSVQFSKLWKDRVSSSCIKSLKWKIFCTVVGIQLFWVFHFSVGKLTNARYREFWDLLCNWTELFVLLIARNRNGWLLKVSHFVHFLFVWFVLICLKQSLPLLWPGRQQR